MFAWLSAICRHRPMSIWPVPTCCISCMMNWHAMTSICVSSPPVGGSVTCCEPTVLAKKSAGSTGS